MRTVPKTLARSWKCGQNNRADATRLWAEIEGILEREYYTESGPLVRRLEKRLGELLGAQQVVCVGNPSVAWAMLLDASGVSGQSVIVPATAPRRLLEGLAWADCKALLCPVRSEDGWQLSAEQIQAAVISDAVAIVGVHEWGGACDVERLKAHAMLRQQVLLFDASSSLAVRYRSGSLAAQGEAAVLSFDTIHLLDAYQGAAIVTDNIDLADRLRCMRSSGGIQRRVKVNRTVNGRMSEAQAAQALVLLDDLPSLLARNFRQFNHYQEKLRCLQDIVWLTGFGVEETNCEQAVIELRSSDAMQRLKALCIERSLILPSLLEDAVYLDSLEVHKVRVALQSSVLALPLGQDVDDDDIRCVSEVVRQALTC